MKSPVCEMFLNTCLVMLVMEVVKVRWCWWCLCQCLFPAWLGWQCQFSSGGHGNTSGQGLIMMVHDNGDSCDTVVVMVASIMV